MNGRELMILMCDDQKYKARAFPAYVRDQKASQGYPVT